MKISVIIPTKNRPKDLLVAVNSITHQTFSPYELVIVDQSKTPESKIHVKELLDNNTCNIILKYIYDPSISGLVHAKKIGVTYSDGDVICFLEDDIELTSNYIDEINLSFSKNENMMGCCGVVTNLPKRSSSYALFFHFFHRGIFFDKRVGVYGYIEQLKEELISSNYLSGGTSAFRRAVFEKISFDVFNKFHMLEDIDFSVRVAKHYGDNSLFINPKAKLAHYMSPLNRAMYKARYQRKLREFIVFYKKHTRGVFDFIALLWLLLGLLIEAIVASATARRLSPFWGYFIGLHDGIKHKLKGDF